MKEKVTIIGAGMVGSTLAYSLVARDIAEEIALIDLDEKLVRAQVMDLQHSVSFFGSTCVKVGSYDDCADSSVVAICCGSAQKPGQTRLDLVKQNAAIMKSVLPRVFEKNPNVVLVMITNPVDVLTALAVKMFPHNKKRIMGTGTLLDSSRLRHLIGQKVGVSPKSVHAYIIGEHGDSEFPYWSRASIGGMMLGRCDQLSDEEKRNIFEEAKNAAYAIIEGKQATYYAIGAGASRLIRSILHDEKNVFAISHVMESEDALEDVCLSVPAVVGAEGVLNKLCIEFSPQEKEQLRHSAEVLKEVVTQTL